VLTRYKWRLHICGKKFGLLIEWYFISSLRHFLELLFLFWGPERCEEFYFGILRDNTPLDASLIKINIGFAIKVLFNSIFMLITCRGWQDGNIFINDVSLWHMNSRNEEQTVMWLAVCSSFLLFVYHSGISLTQTKSINQSFGIWRVMTERQTQPISCTLCDLLQTHNAHTQILGI